MQTLERLETLEMQGEEYGTQVARLFPEEFTGGKKAKTVTFQVTEDCNLRCTYCYQIDKCKTSMPIDIGKKGIDFLLESTPENNSYINYENSPAIIIDFIGGEPLLEIDTIVELIEYFKKRSIELNHPWATRHRFCICSNGLLYFNSRFQNLLKKYGDEISFSISIDGTKELHDMCRVLPDGSGSYDIAIKGVKHYQTHYHGKMGSKMTIAPENIVYVASAIKNLLELGYTDINLNCIHEKGWDYSHATEFYNQLIQAADYMIDSKAYLNARVSIFSMNIGKPLSPNDNNNWCGGTGSMLAIDYKGDIFPCIRYMGSSLGKGVKPIIIGNIYDGIGKKPEELQTIRCLECITRRSQSTDECFNCPIAAGCAWCSAYNYQEFGTVDKRATYICPMHKARVLANVYYWNKIFRQENLSVRFKNWVPEKWALDIISPEDFSRLNRLAELN